MILKNADEINSKTTLKEITAIMDSLGYNYTVDSTSDINNEFHIGVTDPNCSTFCMFVFDKPSTKDIIDDDFAWISPNHFVAVMFEDITNSEESILKICYEYFKIFPKEFFWAEESWFYTKDDIDNSFKFGDCEYWCYKKPRLKE